MSRAAVFRRGYEDKAVEAARRQAATAHGADECLAASAHCAKLLVRAISGASKAKVLDTAAERLGGKVAEIARGGWREKLRSQIRSTGYVIDSLEAAIWCTGKTTSFEEAVVLAVNLGDDADTVGAITGQLAGAIYGAAAIPAPWLAPLASGLASERRLSFSKPSAATRQAPVPPDQMLLLSSVSSTTPVESTCAKSKTVCWPLGCGTTPLTVMLAPDASGAMAHDCTLPAKSPTPPGTWFS